MDDDAIVFDHHDKVLKWRREELLRMWPSMSIADAEELSARGPADLLARAKQLSDGGCPVELAVSILR